MFKRWSSNQALEYWKSIENYPNYMISSLGRVKSLERMDSIGRVVKEKILKLGVSGGGYLRVSLYKNEKAKIFYVHRLVGQAFIPNVDNKPYIDHINTIKTDNRVCNLRWVTSKENSNNPLTREKLQGEKHPMYGKHHREETKKIMRENNKGEKNPRARKVRCIETGEIFDCIKYACEWCGLKSISDIAKQIKGEQKSAGTHPVTKERLHWTYVD